MLKNIWFLRLLYTNKNNVNPTFQTMNNHLKNISHLEVFSIYDSASIGSILESHPSGRDEDPMVSEPVNVDNYILAPKSE